MKKHLSISDDSGLLGLVDAQTYETYVSESWTYEQLVAHFAKQSAKGSILVWDCGDGGDIYRVDVNLGFTSEVGFREATGSLNLTGKQFNLASYTALTMAAQFDDCGIPAKTEADLSIACAPGDYRVRIVQMYDPNSPTLPMTGPHFCIEIEPGTTERWSSIQWAVA